MRLVALAVLFLCACASSPPQRKFTYCDGLEACVPEVFTPPGYIPAGVGLPEYRPVEDEPVAPRSPYARVLPQTPQTRREAGLWAGNEPRAAIEDYNPAILGIVLPVPDIEPRYDKASRWSCVARVARYADEEAERRGGANFSESVRGCMAAQVVLSCLSDRLAHFTEEAENGNPQHVAARESHRRLEGWAARIMRLKRDGVEPDGAAREFMKTVNATRKSPPLD